MGKVSICKNLLIESYQYTEKLSMFHIIMFIMGFIVLVSSRRDTPSQYGEGRNISVSRLRYSANHNAPDSWPIRAHFSER